MNNIELLDLLHAYKQGNINDATIMKKSKMTVLMILDLLKLTIAEQIDKIFQK